MRGIARLVFVAGIAILAFVVALISFRTVPAKECQMSSVRDPSYHVEVEEEPEVNLTTYHVLVTRNDRPVEGAQVCMRADMGGLGKMSGMGASNVGRQVGPGRYEVPIRLEMGGHWGGIVIVSEKGRRPVGTPLSLEVT